MANKNSEFLSNFVTSTTAVLRSVNKLNTTTHMKKRKPVTMHEEYHLTLAVKALQLAEKSLKKAKKLQKGICYPRVPHGSFSDNIRENVSELKSIIKKGWAI